MASDELELIAQAIRDLDRRQRDTQDAVAGLRARIEALVDVLVAKEVLAPQHRRHFERCAKNGADEKPRVRLQVYDPDKYNMQHGEPVDCSDRIALCKSRCCTLAVVLSEQDLAEGKLAWELDQPYVLRRDPDGRCVYQDRATGGCTNYDHRPATCRSYSCKDDRRIWLDFDNKIPAPLRLTSDDDELVRPGQEG